MPLQPFQSVASTARRPSRLRRSVLAVPGSSQKMLRKAAQTEADAVFLDLEDAVAPEHKATARASVIEALHTVDYGDKTVAVRVNGATTPFQHEDIVALVRGAHRRFDCLVLPKVEHPGQLWFVDTLLAQLELELGVADLGANQIAGNGANQIADLGAEQTAGGRGGRVGIEVQVESGAGLVALREVATVTDRTETLVLGPGDLAADLGVPQLHLGTDDADYPGDRWHAVLMTLVTTARAVGIDAIDGPYSDYADLDGLRRTATRARLLGIDGKWCIHPSQVAVVNEAFTPAPEQLDRAQALLAAYDAAIADGRGAATFEGAMIDEASRKMATKLLDRGRAAGLA